MGSRGIAIQCCCIQVKKITMDRRTWKLINMNGALHPKSDISMITSQDKRRGRGLISLEICVRL